MSTRTAQGFDVYRQAEQTATEWLRTAAEHLETDDPHRAHRVVRAWLHAVRDRVGVETAAHLAGQLPLLWRGVFYDGWQPSRVPFKYDAEHVLAAVAQDADLSDAEARGAVAAVTAALTELTSPDLIGHVMAALPAGVRAVLSPGRDESGLARRVEELEHEARVLTDALSSLLASLDQPPTTDPDPAQRTAAARRAHQILLSRGRTG